MTQFTKIRQETASEFTCSRCGQVKTSKLRFAFTEDGETKYICNGCYGYLMSKNDNAITSKPQTEGTTMQDNKTEHVSLCRVSVSGEEIWLIRIADIENGTLRLPKIDKNAEGVFENRTRLYRNDGPDTDGAFGVWKWSAVPNAKNPDKDYVHSSHLSYVQVIEIIELEGFGSPDEIANAMKKGLELMPVTPKFLLCTKRGEASFFDGVLLTDNDIIKANSKYSLKGNTLYLPFCSPKASNTLAVDGKIFCTEQDCGKSTRNILLKSKMEIIANIIRDKLSWSNVKPLNVSKTSWQTIAQFIVAMPNRSILQEIRKIFECDDLQAQSYVDEFIMQANAYISRNDYETEVLAALVEHNSALMDKCVEIAVSRHHQEIDNTQAKIDSALAALAAKNDELARVESEISSAQEKLLVLEKDIHEHEQLASDVEERVRKRIADARSDAAAFIAEMAFTTQEAARVSEHAVHTGQALPAENLKSVSDWRKLVEILGAELAETGVSEKYSSGFAAYLYSAYVNKIPVLLAGPGGSYIADAFSAAVSGRTSGVIDCSEKYYAGIEKDIVSADDEVFAVVNALRNEWITYIPELAAYDKHFFIIHPFTEDLLIEPKSLLSYVLPVLTEPVMESLPVGELCGAVKTGDFADYSRTQTKQLYHAQLKALGLSGYTRSLVQSVLTDFHEIFRADNDMDYLFGLLPYAYISGKLDSELLNKLSDGELRDELKLYELA